MGSSESGNLSLGRSPGTQNNSQESSGESDIEHTHQEIITDTTSSSPEGTSSAAAREAAPAEGRSVTRVAAPRGLGKRMDQDAVVGGENVIVGH